MTESMTSTQRIKAVIGLEKPDRVPIAPLIMFYSGRHAGITMEEYLFSPETADRAVERTFDDMGGWDVFCPMPRLEGRTVYMRPTRINLPGKELPVDSVYQIDDTPLMKVEDYDLLFEKGYGGLYSEMIRRAWPNVTAEQLKEIRTGAREGIAAMTKKWNERGVPSMISVQVQQPFDDLCQFRSFEELTKDMFRRPDVVQRALEMATPAIIEIAKRAFAGGSGMAVWVSGLRASSTFLSIKQFERFVLPSLKQTVDALAAADIPVLLHFDQDWGLNLRHLKELPAKKCILALDGTTDIFKAKEILGDHMCLMGDVPGTLLSLGSPQEVREYVRRLIEGAGEGGGFILSTGCECPVDAKPENVKAMIDAGKEFGVY